MLTKIELTEAEMQKTSALKVSHALELAKNGQFWMLLVFTLFVTQIYDTYDQQFAQYFFAAVPTPEEGNRWYGIWPPFRYAAKRCLCLMPWFVNRTGAKWALIIAGLIMSVRIVGSAIPLGPVWIGAVKMMHALEKPLILVSVFKFIAANFDHKLSSTVYLLVLFVASIATAIYSPLARYLYDTIGFAHLLSWAASPGCLPLISVFTLRDNREPTAPEAAGAGVAQTINQNSPGSLFRAN
jgi:OHS family lactose permease-like MFS transporter